MLHRQIKLGPYRSHASKHLVCPDSVSRCDLASHTSCKIVNVLGHHGKVIISRVTWCHFHGVEDLDLHASFINDALNSGLVCVFFNEQDTNFFLVDEVDHLGHVFR